MERERGDAVAALDRHARDRDGVLDRIVEALSSDDRVGAAWLSGSFGRGEADRWSDLDLHVAVRDDHFESFLADRSELFRRVGQPVLVQREMASEAMAGARFTLVLYAGAVEVDWNVGPVSLASRTPATRMLFDRVGVSLVEPALSEDRRQDVGERWLSFFWLMAPIAAKYCGRGHTRRAINQLSLLTGAATTLWRLVNQPTGPNPDEGSANRVLEPALVAWMPRLGPTIDVTTCLETVRALCRQVEALHPALAELGVSIPVAVVGEVYALVDLADAVLLSGAFDARPRSIAGR